MQLARFDKECAKKAVPLMVINLINTVSGLGGTQHISLPVRVC